MSNQLGKNLFKFVRKIQLESVRYHRVTPLPDPMPYTTAIWRKRYPFRNRSQFEVTHDEVYTKDMQLKTLDERRQGKKKVFKSSSMHCFTIEFDPQPIRVDEVNIGILEPISTISKMENRARLKHSTNQRNRADLKKLHYDGARMYSKKKPIELKRKFSLI